MMVVANALPLPSPVQLTHQTVERFVVRPLLQIVEVAAAVLLVADLVVVMCSVLSRFFFDDPLVWSDDVARALLLAVCFLGAAAALAHGENAGVTFFVDRLERRRRRKVDAVVALTIALVAAALCWNAVLLLKETSGQTVGAGLPQELFIAPLCFAAGAMTVFAIHQLFGIRALDLAAAVALFAIVGTGWLVWSAVAPGSLPDQSILMLIAFLVALIIGVPIAFVLALTTLVYIWSGDILPGEIFAQQLARGIDNFVLLAVPFFILVGYLMEANGMSVRLIALLQRAVGRLRGGLDVVMVLSMVVFSGISGSKMADVAAVGSVLVPAARKSGQKPGDAVALLAASAVMAETIPPCVNLIILGFVANISIGGLFVAGLLPSALMAGALIVMAVVQGKRGLEGEFLSTQVAVPAQRDGKQTGLISSAVVAFGLIALIFGGYRSGFATATEISAFAVVYALVVGSLAFRETTWRSAGQVMRHAAVRSGMVLFIVAAAQSLAYVLTLQQIPHALAEIMVSLSSSHGTWLFLLLTVLILIVMGSVLEGAAALIIFGPLLMPVARQLGIDPLHYGIILVIGMGIGLFAPPLGLGLYGSCLIGGVKLEETVRPIMKYLGILFICLLIITFVPGISTLLPRAFGY
jgi:tripartite ATP-independent transporter DctM subunit